MENSIYFKQANLVLDVLPFISAVKCFALKGGTAINFFFRDLPRLSVDIDLCYLPVNSRETALKEISKSLEKISTSFKSRYREVNIFAKPMPGAKTTSSLIINRNGIIIKVEPNLIVRGTVFKAVNKEITEKAKKIFEKSVYASCLDFSDLYAGKICAALDRQHPRDLFDIKLLLENEGITNRLRKTFIVYLISHPRPMSELLSPNLLDLKNIFVNEFKDITRLKVSLKDLYEARVELIHKITKSFTAEEKQFILSVKKKSPNWELSGLKNIRHLPAVKWKLVNLEQMAVPKHKAAVEKLRKILEI